MRAISQMQPVMPEWLSAGAADFINGALVKQAGSRQRVSELLQHPWILHHQAQRWARIHDVFGAAKGCV